MSDQPEPLEWSVKAGDGRLREKSVVLAFAVLAGLAGVGLLQSPLMGLVGFFVVLVSTAELFLPIRYRLDAEGASARCGPSVTTVRWVDAKRLIESADGVRVSSLDRPGRMDAFRGVFLRTPGNRDAVLRKIRELWGRDEAVLGRGDDAGTGGGDDRPARRGSPEAADAGSGGAVPGDAQAAGERGG